ncbi:translation factor GTPase family protein [Amycolatopsis sp.]|uniref:translation factor GTPase family protein n=1 Tax=Amycolatopsis sp. TaxID=37632 RepID=UPI002E05426F|nr:translation factor GTPase family protein [Amycolatopsis sp.]
MRMLNLGILAHVDAGKTSLTERLLFEGGAIARMGAVDEGSTQTDAMDLERRRGITIRSAVATFTSGDHEIHLIDTPGHADFIAEVERALGVLDGAILVLSAIEGVQAQTRLLMRTLKAMGLPTLLFVNKIDRPGARYESLMADIERWLSPSAISMRDPQRAAEILAEHNDDVLKTYLYETESLDADTLREELAAQISAALVHPVFFGSAVTGAGIDALLQGITDFLPTAQGDDTAPLDGTVFAIEQDKQAVARIFSGSVTARDIVTYSRRTSTGTIVESAKVTAVHPGHVGAGGIARLTGLRGIKVGDRLGSSSTRPEPPRFRPPTLETVVTSQNPGDLYTALSELAEQDPLINVRRDPRHHTITVSLYGEVQQEVLAARLSEEYGVDAAFSPPRIICVERPVGVGSAVEFMGQSPYPATVGLRVEPSATGNQFVLEAERGSLPRAFLTAIEETVAATLREGLHGWQVTDCSVVLTHTGYDSPVTVAADFRIQTREVLTTALRNARTAVCEPIDRLTLEIPAPALSSVLTALTTSGALPDPPTLTGETYTLTALIPTAHLRAFEWQLPALTGGTALLTTHFHTHRPR